MPARNSPESYGWVTKWLHWVMAVAIMLMLALGTWMVSLDYYHPWYRLTVQIHESVGLLLIPLLAFRLVWRCGERAPDDPWLKPWERLAARIVQRVMLALLVGIVISGYLTATADGRGITLFGPFQIPALVTAKGIEEQAGAIHHWLTHILTGLVGLHILAAFKHHFIDRNPVLLRMLPSREKRKNP